MIHIVNIQHLDYTQPRNQVLFHFSQLFDS